MVVVVPVRSPWSDECQKFYRRIFSPASSIQSLSYPIPRTETYQKLCLVRNVPLSLSLSLQFNSSSKHPVHFPYLFPLGSLITTSTLDHSILCKLPLQIHFQLDQQSTALFLLTRPRQIAPPPTRRLLLRRMIIQNVAFIIPILTIPIVMRPLARMQKHVFSPLHSERTVRVHDDSLDLISRFCIVLDRVELARQVRAICLWAKNVAPTA